MKCLSNLPKADRQFVLGAIEASGLHVEWREVPDARMDSYKERSDWGSIWSSEPETGPFWREFEIRKYGEPLSRSAK